MAYSLEYHRSAVARLLVVELLATIGPHISFLVVAPVLRFGANSHTYIFRRTCAHEFFMLLEWQVAFIIFALLGCVVLKVRHPDSTSSIIFEVLK